jgi:hypothetical protein
VEVFHLFSKKNCDILKNKFLFQRVSYVSFFSHKLIRSHKSEERLFNGQRLEDTKEAIRSHKSEERRRDYSMVKG